MHINSWIKNMILIVLIILIFHFYIKNCLLEKASFTENLAGLMPDTTPSKPLVDNSSDSYPFYHNLKKCEKDVNMHSSKKAELLEYVFSDSDESLQKYFQDDAVSRPVKDLESSMKKDQFSSCKPRDDLELPLSTSCGNDFSTLKNDKPEIDDCILNQKIKNGTLIKEYTDESSLNSGSLFDGTLQAYDGNLYDYATPLDGSN